MRVDNVEYTAIYQPLSTCINFLAKRDTISICSSMLIGHKGWEKVEEGKPNPVSVCAGGEQGHWFKCPLHS